MMEHDLTALWLVQDREAICFTVFIFTDCPFFIQAVQSINTVQLFIMAQEIKNQLSLVYFELNHLN